MKGRRLKRYGKTVKMRKQNKWMVMHSYQDYQVFRF